MSWSVRAGAAAAEQRADARLELRHVERLAEIVVGAGVEAAHRVARRALRGEHEDGHHARLAAQRARDVHPVAVGKSDVEHERVVVVRARERETLGVVGGRIHGVALLAKHEAHEVAHVGVVFNDQQLGHPRTPSRPIMKKKTDPLQGFVIEGRIMSHHVTATRVGPRSWAGSNAARARVRCGGRRGVGARAASAADPRTHSRGLTPRRRPHLGHVRHRVGERGARDGRQRDVHAVGRQQRTEAGDRARHAHEHAAGRPHVDRARRPVRGGPARPPAR